MPSGLPLALAHPFFHCPFSAPQPNHNLLYSFALPPSVVFPVRCFGLNCCRQGSLNRPPRLDIGAWHLGTQQLRFIGNAIPLNEQFDVGLYKMPAFANSLRMCNLAMRCA